MTELLPSLLSANLLSLQEDLHLLQQAGIKKLHVDVMDGHFVPNLTFGPEFVRQLRQGTSFWLDVHLMINPLFPHLEAFVRAGAHSLTFHVEACEDIAETIAYLKEKGCCVGLSLKPGTPLEQLIPWLQDIDLVLVMTVEPGFGGQAFQAEQLHKIKTLHTLKAQLNPALIIEVDGGITLQTAQMCLEAGAESFVAGTSVFGGGRTEIPLRVKAFHDLFESRRSI